MAGKFVLLLVMSRYFEPEEVGIYGLLFASVMYAIFFIGLDFYAYSTREIISSKFSAKTGYIKSHFTITGISLLLFYLLCTMLFVLGLIERDIYLGITVLVTIEYFAQEFYRLLIAVSLTLEATILLFLRTGLWPFIVSPVLILSTDLRSIETIVYAWIAGTSCSVLYALHIVRREIGIDWRIPANWSWVWKGLLISFPFLISSLSMRGVMTLDRYFFAMYNRPELVGIYVFYIGIAGLILIVVDTTIFIFAYPKLVAAAQLDEKNSFSIAMKKVAISVFSLSLGLVFTLWFLIDYIVLFTGRDIYSNYLTIYYLMLLTFFLLNVSNVYHFGLYAMGKDKHLVLGNFLCLIVFCVSVLFLSTISMLLAVSIAMFLSVSVLLCWKYFCYKNDLREFLSDVSGATHEKLN